VVAFGLGFGVGTIAKPVLLADRYDTRQYATIAGLLVVPMTIAKATAPLAAGLHTTSAGYNGVFAATAAACLIARSGTARGAGASSPQPLGEYLGRAERLDSLTRAG
jgi:hypothetical protein